MENKEFNVCNCTDESAKSILNAYYNGLECPVQIKKYEECVLLKKEDAIDLLEMAKNEYPVLRYFSDSFLLSNSVKLFGWRILYRNSKYIYKDTIPSEMLAAPYAETVVLLISVYEHNRNKNKDFKLMDFYKIGPDKAKKMLNAFYEYSNGKYDPEPELRKELNNGSTN